MSKTEPKIEPEIKIDATQLEMRSFLFELLSYQTTADKPEEIKKAMDFIAKVFESSQFQIHRYEKNGHESIVISTHGNKQSKVILSGHLDVVPAESDRSFSPKEIDGKVYARGASDMKGSVSALIFALLELDGNQDLFRKDISLILTSDEETGGDFGAGYLVEEVGYSADIVLLPDGGNNWYLCTDEKGPLRLNVTVYGISAHGSRPWKGENAILKSLRMYDDMKAMIEAKWGITDDGKEWLPTINLGSMHGGENGNSVPDLAISNIDIRYPADVNGKELLSALQNIGNQYEADIRVALNGIPTNINESNAYLQSWEDSVREVRGVGMGRVMSEGASDAQHYRRGNIPSIITMANCSPGHIEDEWVDYDDLLVYKEVVKNWLLKV